MFNSDICISRQDIDIMEPASKRIDWSKGPYYNDARPNMRPAYYPQRPEATMKPFERNYDEYEGTNNPGIPTQHNSFAMTAGYNPSINYPMKRQKPRYEERPLPETSGVTGPHSFVQDNGHQGKEN